MGVAKLNWALPTSSVQMFLIPNALCCSLYKRNCVCAVTKFLSAKNFMPTSAGKTHKRSCTSAMINRGHLELATSPGGGGGKARFNVATPTYATVTYYTVTSIRITV